MRSSVGQGGVTDLVLLFPPQWSPFQPALSTPSLSAWVKHAGFSCTSIDLNIQFYRYILSAKFGLVAAALLDARQEAWSSDRIAAYRQVIDSRDRILQKLGAIRAGTHTN